VTQLPGNGSTVFLVRPGRAPVAVYQTAHGARPAALFRWPGTGRGCRTPHPGATRC
jgi:hypothetical protein